MPYIDDSEKTMRMEQGRPVELRIEVKTFDDGEAAFTVWCNKKQVWQWRGLASKLTDAPYGKPPDIKHFSVRGASGLTIEAIDLERVQD